MDQQSIQDFIIQKYQDEERTMVHIFVEWCRNHKLDPHMIYHLAYPEQEENLILTEIINELDDQAPVHIPNETLLEILQVFGNNDLAFVVAEFISKSSENKN